MSDHLLDVTVTDQVPPGAGAEPASQFVGASRRAFFDVLIAELRRALPDDLDDFTTRGFGGLVKVIYLNERVHYEVWVEADRRRIGLGLHFEDGPASTAAFLRYFDARIVELKERLGPRIDLGRWTTSWGHLYEIHECPLLTREAARQTAARLAELIEVLEPLVRAAAIHPERSTAHDGASSGTHWRRRRSR